MGLTKQKVLTFLAQAPDADAQGVALAFGVSYSVSAMALLRLVRQGLAGRRRHVEGKVYRYHLTERGRSRLEVLRTGGGSTG
ncbi:MAG: hypothetical protein E6H04_04900 [Bacillati bacterium ANGP1]|uniref:MarR family transcriptional regulator n=1 Tax=Candidatus Segetimicrobium genomatis TaxID=2569760 RepID=A0A537JFP6_9BACT|nr:MAG: hypothetical protein E6H04_04900 [Terrabacteria group bacterium ANGP1]